MIEMVTTDELLGPVRWCSSCDEWWPDDGEFWRDGARLCRACLVDATERRRASVREAARRYRARLRSQRLRQFSGGSS